MMKNNRTRINTDPSGSTRIKEASVVGVKILGRGADAYAVDLAIHSERIDVDKPYGSVL